MINLRYHIVSITAVFLALGLGVLMGTTVINQGVVKALDTRSRSQNTRIDRLEAQVVDLQDEIGLWDRFGERMVPALTQGRLNARRAILVEQDGVDGGFVDELEATIIGAGGALAGRLRLSDKWTLDDEPSRERLALAAGLAPSEPDLLGEAAQRIGARLASPADPAQEGDLLRALESAGFLQMDEIPAGPFPVEGALVIVAASGAEGARPGPEFFLPLLRALGAAPRALVAEPLGAHTSVVARVRGDSTLKASVATVDHADTGPGLLSLVFALRDAASSKARHYGARRDASSLAPPPFASRE